MKEQKQRAQWGSKLGFILAAAGSAIGLGNIWKFPGKAYEGGGAGFILIYFAIIFLIGLPLMVAELSLGRASQSNAVDAFRRLNPKFTWIGYIGIFIAFIVTCYYAHVGGWVLRYFVSYATGPSEVYADPDGYFMNLLGATEGGTHFPWLALLFGFLMLLFACVIVVRGVQGGIEKFNKVTMPLLFVILLILLVRILTMEGTREGILYMLTPDFGKVTLHTVLMALGQAFYSLSIGMAILVTYGSYLPKNESIVKNSAIICLMDTLVATVAGFIIVPATLASGQNVGKGGSFAFVSLAGVFEAMPGGAVFGALFYLLLFFAAMTSCISLIEGVLAFLVERFGLRRTPTAIVLCVLMFAIGSLYTLSQVAYPIKGIWFDFKNWFYTLGFGDFLEYLTDLLLIPLCALATCIFIGWFWKPTAKPAKGGFLGWFLPNAAIGEIEADGKAFRLAVSFSVLLKIVAPISIAVILLSGLLTGQALS